MSAYEQKLEVPDKNYQYLLFACDPYETIAFKVEFFILRTFAYRAHRKVLFQIPNLSIDRREGRFFTNWDTATHKLVVQLHFLEAHDADLERLKQNQSVPAPRPQQLNFI